MNNLQSNDSYRWKKNGLAMADDWCCPSCRKFNPVTAKQCTLCGETAVNDPLIASVAPTINHLDMLDPVSFAVQVTTASTLCLRNRTLSTWWLYIEHTAPLHWVQLRPGEACDIPCARYSIFTIGASKDEPNPKAIIGQQFGIAFGILAAAVLVFFPDPGSKVAIFAYLVSAIATTGGITGGAILMGISNESNLKQVGVQTRDGAVWELTDELVYYTSLADGSRVGVYSYSWSDVTESVGWSARFNNWNQVMHGEDRGNLEELAPIDNTILQEIRHHADIGKLYLDSIAYWNEQGQLDQHVFSYGGSGGTETATVYGASTSEANEKEYGLITEVRVWADKFIDAIQVKYNNQTKWERVTGAGHCRTAGIFSDSSSTDHGGAGGYFKCEADEYISKIVIKHDKYIVSLQFFTNKDVHSHVFGGSQGDGDDTDTIPNEHGGEGGWIGYQCTFAKWMDSMKFVFGDKKPAE